MTFSARDRKRATAAAPRYERRNDLKARNSGSTCVVRAHTSRPARQVVPIRVEGLGDRGEEAVEGRLEEGLENRSSAGARGGAGAEEAGWGEEVGLGGGGIRI